MRSLSPLDQLAVAAFVTALETCRETGVELPDDVWAIAAAPEQHLTALSEIAQQYPQLNTAYRTARKLLRQAESDRQKRIDFHDLKLVTDQFRLKQQELETRLQALLESQQQQVEEQSRKFNSLLQEQIQSSLELQQQQVKEESRKFNSLLQEQIQSSAIQRIVLAANASDRDRQNYQKYLEELQRLNPDWAIVPDCPQAGEADAHLAIWKDQDYLARHAAYIATRYLNEFFRELSL
ncbi:hypothetical protein [Trichothermofontia sp.]